MKSIKFFLSLIIIFSYCKQNHAQSPSPSGRDGVGLLPINLETVLKLAGANNLVVKEYEVKYQIALAEQAKAKEWWLPNIYFGATTHFLNGAAMNTDGRIFTDITRNNLWVGLGFAMEWDFNKGIYNSLAEKQKADAMQYESQAERNEAILKTITAYYDLLAEQMKYSSLAGLVNEADTLARQIKIKADAGLLYQAEYLMAQSNYSHLKISLLQSKNDWQKKSSALINLLNLDGNVLLLAADSILIPVEMAKTIPDTSQQKNLFEKRPEYMSLQSGLSALNTERKIYNNGLLLPKLRIGTDDALFGKIYSPYYNTYQLNVSLLWNLPLARFSYKGDLKKYDSKILLEQNKIEQFKNQAKQEVSDALAQIQYSKEQIQIAKESLQQSSEALKQGMERQKLGTAKPFEVFQAQQFYLQSQTDYVKAVAEYNKAQYALKVTTGMNL